LFFVATVATRAFPKSKTPSDPVRLARFRRGMVVPTFLLGGNTGNAAASRARVTVVSSEALLNIVMNTKRMAVIQRKEGRRLTSNLVGFDR